MTMADRIKERRIALGLTQEELATRIGLQKSAIAKYENGRVENIKRSIILKMADVLQCTPSYLLALDDSPTLVFRDTTDPPFGKKENENNYYLDPATADLAQKMYENKDMRVLFDAAQDASPEDLRIAYDMLLALKKKERR